MINFSTDRWGPLHKTYAKWFKRELDRPLINLTIYGAPSKEEKPEGYKNQPLWLYPRTEDPAKIVDTYLRDLAYTLSTELYAGDSYPVALPDYGAGINAAFYGARTDVRDDTVWFLPPAQGIDPEALHLVHNPACWEYRMLRYFYQKASRLFDGQVVLAMTHLNNGIDPVARFFEGPDLLMALYDSPEAVKRLVAENHLLYEGYVKEFMSLMVPSSPGQRCAFLSDKIQAACQSDFSAMISTEMYKEFILPELKQCWAFDPEKAWYHLDGPGQLPHLDTLISQPELRAIQWVPGPKKWEEPMPIRWQDVYKKINEANINQWFIGDISEIRILEDVLGTAKGIYWEGYVPYGKIADKFLRFMEQLGVPLNV